MRKTKLCVSTVTSFTILMIAALSPLAAFAFDLTAVGSFQNSTLTTNYGGGNDSVVSQGVTFTNNGFTSGTSFGGGVLFSEFLAPDLSLEDGFLYLPRIMTGTQTVSTSGGSGTISENLTFNYIQIPVLVRFHFRDIFSFGLGGYYAHSLGNIRYTYFSSNTALQAALPSGTQTASYKDNGVSQSDVGLLFALGAKVPISDTNFSIYGDARFDLGLKNIQTGPVTSVSSSDFADDNKWRDFQIFLGVSYSFRTGAKVTAPAESEIKN